MGNECGAADLLIDPALVDISNVARSTLAVPVRSCDASLVRCAVPASESDVRLSLSVESQ